MGVGKALDNSGMNKFVQPEVELMAAMDGFGVIDGVGVAIGLRASPGVAVKFIQGESSSVPACTA